MLLTSRLTPFSHLVSVCVRAVLVIPPCTNVSNNGTHYTETDEVSIGLETSPLVLMTSVTVSVPLRHVFLALSLVCYVTPF